LFLKQVLIKLLMRKDRAYMEVSCSICPAKTYSPPQLCPLHHRRIILKKIVQINCHQPSHPSQQRSLLVGFPNNAIYTQRIFENIHNKLPLAYGRYFPPNRYNFPIPAVNPCSKRADGTSPVAGDMMLQFMWFRSNM
jgi:hypothetical protein